MGDSAYTTAALIGVMMALVKLVEKGMQKSSGGSIEYRLGLLETQIIEMREKLADFSRCFYEFREEYRIRVSVQQAKEENDE